MILIADGGSTKTEWCLVDNGKIIEQIITEGTNPFFQTEDEISKLVETHILPKVGNQEIKNVYFYGAGCAFPDKNEIVRAAIARHINAPVHIASDLLGAARALCGTSAGIACIIGTGSNSCYYDGKEIVTNVSPLGFILGDEGSGAVIGKLFVNACLKNQLTPGIKEQFLKEFDFEPGYIIDRVYRQTFPNRFLASLSPFIIKNLEDPTIYKLVVGSFKDFFIKNVMQYDYKSNKVHFVGSIAHYYNKALTEAASELGIQLGTVNRTPMDNLIEYHKQNM